MQQPILASAGANGCPPTEQRCCFGSRLSAGRSLTDGVACARFACCVIGHRTARKTFPPQKGSSNQEELYQEVALPSPAQMLACHTPMTLQLCLLHLRVASQRVHPPPEEMGVPAGSNPRICTEDVWAVSSPVLSSKKEGLGFGQAEFSRLWDGREKTSPATILRIDPCVSCFQPCYLTHQHCSSHRLTRSPNHPCAARENLLLLVRWCPAVNCGSEKNKYYGEIYSRCLAREVDLSHSHNLIGDMWLCN